MIEGTKKWDDNNNLFGFRPSVDELNSQGLISFEVIRYAEAQPGMRNAIGSALYPLKVVDEQGTIIAWLFVSSATFLYDKISLIIRVGLA